MITFYPCDIEMWRKDFCFNNDITLTPKEKTNYKIFYNRDEFIEFLKEHDVRLDDTENPLEFRGPRNNETLVNTYYDHKYTYDVIQGTLLGWIKDDYVS